MNITNPSKFTKTNYNTLFNFKKSSYPTNYEKIIKGKTSTSNDKSFINNSMLTTKLNSSDSFRFKSLYIKNNKRLFRMKNTNSKRELYTSFSFNKNQKFFKKFIRKKFLNNIDKIKKNQIFIIMIFFIVIIVLLK